MNKETQPLTQEQVDMKAIKPLALTLSKCFNGSDTYDEAAYKLLKQLTPELLNKLGLQQKDVSLINEANNHRIKPTKPQDSLQQEKECKLKSDWIKIEEGCEMPEDETKVIVKTVGVYHKMSGNWYDYETDQRIDAIEWQPLPQPPIN